MTEKWKYEQPSTPLFLCGSEGCSVEFESEEKQSYIEEARHKYARAYRKQHGEFPRMDLQLDVVMEAAEAFDRRAQMKPEQEDRLSSGCDVTQTKDSQ